MQYLGGKTNLLRRGMDAFWRGRLSDCTRFVDVCCGSGAVTAFVGREFPQIELVANDLHPAVIPLLRAVAGQDPRWPEGWTPPQELSEAQYSAIKVANDPSDPLNGFAGFGCSFGAKYMGGYARGASGRNYASGSRKALLKDAAALRRVSFYNLDYADLLSTLGHRPGDVWYVDKPYTGTTKYKGADGFDDARFWQWASYFPGTLLVSEFAAPPPWRRVWGKPNKSDLSQGRNGTNLTREDCVFERQPSAACCQDSASRISRVCASPVRS